MNLWVFVFHVKPFFLFYNTLWKNITIHIRLLVFCYNFPNPIVVCLIECKGSYQSSLFTPGWWWLPGRRNAAGQFHRASWYDWPRLIPDELHLCWNSPQQSPPDNSEGPPRYLWLHLPRPPRQHRRDQPLHLHRPQAGLSSLYCIRLCQG